MSNTFIDLLGFRMSRNIQYRESASEKKIKQPPSAIPDFKFTSAPPERTAEEDLLLDGYEKNQMLRDIYIGTVINRPMLTNESAYKRALLSTNEFYKLKNA